MLCRADPLHAGRPQRDGGDDGARALFERQRRALPRQQRAHQAEARHAVRNPRQAEPGRQRAGFEIATRTPSSPHSSTQPIASSAASRSLCLTALVSSSFRVSAIGIASTSGRFHAAARAPSMRQAIGRPNVRCTEPVIASSTADDRSGPSRADLQAVDLRDRLHLADHLVDRRRPPRAAPGDLLQQPGHALQVVLDPVVHFAHQHLALRDRRLEPRLLRGALFGDIAGDQQQLVRRVAGADQRHQPRVPDVRRCRRGRSGIRGS